jgi:hypothetical protein
MNFEQDRKEIDNECHVVCIIISLHACFEVRCMPTKQERRDANIVPKIMKLQRKAVRQYQNLSRNTTFTVVANPYRRLELSWNRFFNMKTIDPITGEKRT